MDMQDCLLSQFLDGLSYLITENLHHTSLNCSSTLMNLDGEVQIGRTLLESFLQKV
jgi:hypothetical protein